MKEKLLSLIKKAIITKNTDELKVLRLIKTEFINFETAKNASELTSVEEIKILNRMIKQRRESAKQYKEAHRFDLAEAEEKEIEIITNYLPIGPTEEEIMSYVKELTSNDITNIGAYINAVKLKFPTADGKKIADIVKQLLK